MLIYKIFRKPEWLAFEAARESLGAPIDLADGYIHFSTGEQLRETAAKHFTDEADLMLLVLDADTLGGALRWEPSRGGALFPHLYRALKFGDIKTVLPLPLASGGHVFPADIT